MFLTILLFGFPNINVCATAQQCGHPYMQRPEAASPDCSDTGFVNGATAQSVPAAPRSI
jgi:hypothetical protein